MNNRIILKTVLICIGKFLILASAGIYFFSRGIRWLLVEKSLDRLIVEGINKCHLFVFADNTIGNAFWTTSGWTKRGDIFVYSIHLECSTEY